MLCSYAQVYNYDGKGCVGIGLDGFCYLLKLFCLFFKENNITVLSIGSEEEEKKEWFLLPFQPIEIVFKGKIILQIGFCELLCFHICRHVHQLLVLTLVTKVSTEVSSNLHLFNHNAAAHWPGFVWPGPLLGFLGIHHGGQSNNNNKREREREARFPCLRHHWLRLLRREFSLCERHCLEREEIVSGKFDSRKGLH